jgi:cytochrome c biogenesis protein CcmG/thiol:disulfide interchange protein DsbE
MVARRSVVIVASALLMLVVPATAGRNMKAPDFTLTNLGGKEVTLSEVLREGPVLLDFWATWCKPCVKAFPDLQDLYEKYQERGLRVVAVSVDSPKSQARVAPLIKSKSYTFEVLLDTQGRVATKYQVMALPRTLLITPSGEIVYATVGNRPTSHKELEQAILEILPAEAEGDSGAVEKG